MPNRQNIVPDSMREIPARSNYSPAVRVGDMIYVSGQVGRDSEWKPIVGVEEQITKAFENVELVLKAAGAGLDDIVDLLTFHTDMAHMPIVHRVKNQFLKGNHPAWTAIGTSQLYDPEIIIEIKAVAVARGG